MGAIHHIRPNAEADDLPFNVEAEQQVLGAILCDQERVEQVAAAGGAKLFHDPVHRDIFEQVIEKSRAGMSSSPVGLKLWADHHPGFMELGGPAYLVRLAGHSVAGRLVAGYCDLLSDLAARRHLIIAVDTARAALIVGEDPSGVIAGRLEASIVETDMGSGPKPTSMLAAVTRAVEDSWAAFNGESGGRVETGINALDRMIGGFYPGEMTLLGGRPSMGKTAVALSIALNAARAGHGVAIASLEMNPEAMALRAIAEATSRRGHAIPYAAMRRGVFAAADGEIFKQAAQDVADLPITFLSRQFSDVGALFAGAKQARRMLGPENMKLLVVDYAQLLRSPAKSRYEQITDISLALKALSGQLNVPVLALSQLSRQVESRDDKRPMLSDLRESGQLEQDADAVLFCYRDEYYLEREEPDLSEVDKHAAWRGAMERARNKLEIIVAKQRQGEIGTAHVRCNPAQNLIWEG